MLISEMTYRMPDSRTLDYWRIFFRSADNDIFLVIMSAIRVAKADRPRELIVRRQAIIDAIYLQDQPEFQGPEVQVQDNKREEAQASEESKINRKDKKLHEAEDQSGEIEHPHQFAGEIMRIKEVLANWRSEVIHL